MAPIGSIPLAGLTLLEAHRRVAERAHAVYKFVEITLAVAAPRAFEITVSGEVDRPGTMLVTATRRLHDVILEAGGVTPRGSMRRVLVRRKADAEFDLLRFELKGDLSQNPFVEEGLRIVVPPKGPSVPPPGALRRPGEYEIGPDGSLPAPLELVGGLGPARAGADARLTPVGAARRKDTLPPHVPTPI